MYATAISQPCGPVGRQRRRKGPHAGGGMSEHERPEIHTVGIVYRVRSVEAEELALRLVDRIKKDGRVAWCARRDDDRSEEHTSELQSHSDLVCRLLLEKKKK